MFEVKLFEVRDRATFVPCMAVKLDPRENNVNLSEAERYLLNRVGYGDADYVIFGRVEGGTWGYDPHGHGSSRTLTVAHEYVQEHWDELKTGEVIDVEFVLGEKSTKKISERLM